MASTTTSTGKKLVIMGLDNAGKSSLISVVQDKVMGAMDREPTKGIARTDFMLLGQTISVHDLGGQERYRQKYVTENPIVLEGVDGLAFVIDLQDPLRYEKALEYLQVVFERLVSMGNYPPFFLFLHKFDGNYKEDYKDITTRAMIEVDQLATRVKSMAKEHGLTVDGILRTSVRDEWSCFNAFHELWSAVVPKIDSVQNFLDDIVKENPAIGIAIFLDASGNMLAKKLSIKPDIDMEQLVGIAAKSISLLLDWQQSLHHHNVENSEFAILEVEDQSIMLQRLETSSGLFFLVLHAVGGDYKEMQARFARLSFILETIL